MGLFDNIKNLFQPKNVTEETVDPVLKALLSGTEISKKEALSIPAVSSAVDIITSQFAMIPVKLYKREKIDGKSIITEVIDERVRLINYDTNDTLNGIQFKKALAEDYLLGKGGYAAIIRNRNKVKSLNYVQENRVNAMKNADPVFKQVIFHVNERTFEDYELIKLLRNTKDGAIGVPVTREVEKALESAYRTLEFQTKLLKTGGNKHGFLKSDKNLSKEAMTELKNAWANLYANNSETCVVLNNGLDFKESSSSSTELQINETMQTLSGQIDKIFHIYEDDSKTFKYAILPICEAFINELNRVLLLEKEKGTYFFACDYTEILKPNIKERYEAYSLAKNAGWITINEIRRLENKDEIKGLDIIPLSLGNVLFDINTGTYYTPNTNSEYGLNAPKEEENEQSDNQE